MNDLSFIIEKKYVATRCHENGAMLFCVKSAQGGFYWSENFKVAELRDSKLDALSTISVQMRQDSNIRILAVTTYVETVIAVDDVQAAILEERIECLRSQQKELEAELLKQRNKR